MSDISQLMLSLMWLYTSNFMFVGLYSTEFIYTVTASIVNIVQLNQTAVLY